MQLHSNQLIEELTKFAHLFDDDRAEEVPNVPTSLTSSRATRDRIRKARQLIERTKEARQINLPEILDADDPRDAA